MTKNFFTKAKSGFTIVELLVYMGLSTIFLGVLTDIFIAILDSKIESEATSAVEQDSRFILTRLSYDAERASTMSASSNLIMTIGGSTYTYSISGNNLTLNGDNLNSSETKISNLTFQQLGNPGGKPSVQVKFTATSVSQRSKGPEVRNYQTTIAAR